MTNALIDLVREFSRRRIMVIGDVMLDEYLWGHIERISPEAPVPVLRLDRRETMLGGAGNVMKNLASLKVRVMPLAVVGDDDAGEAIAAKLRDAKMDPGGIVKDGNRASTRKSRLMSHEHGQQVFRFDEETQAPISAQTEDLLLNAVSERIEDADAIVCSDYLKGVLTSRVLTTVFQSARALHKITVVGPKDPDPNKYRHASVLIPNAKELSQLTKTDRSNPEWLPAAANKLIQNIEINSLLVTRGGEGMSLFDQTGTSIRRVDIPTVARSVYDVTGAGDTVLSVFTAAIACGAKYEMAAELANIAAGIVVGRRGTVSITPDELIERIHEDASIANPAANA